MDGAAHGATDVGSFETGDRAATAGRRIERIVVQRTQVNVRGALRCSRNLPGADARPRRSVMAKMQRTRVMKMTAERIAEVRARDTALEGADRTARRMDSSAGRETVPPAPRTALDALACEGAEQSDDREPLDCSPEQCHHTENHHRYHHR